MQKTLAICAILGLTASCDPADDEVEARNIPLPEEPDKQEAKIKSDVLAADVLAECLVGEGRTALLSLEVLAGPNLDDWYPFRLSLEGLAHHDMVACLRERVVKEQP